MAQRGLRGIGAVLLSVAALWGCAGPDPGASVGQPARGATAPAADIAARGAEAQGLLEALDVGLRQVLPRSRAVLLGKRDPAGPTCQPFRPQGHTDAGYKPPPKGNLDGGPGNRMLQVYYWQHKDAVRSAPDDYRWHQTTLRRELESLRSRSRDVSARLRPLVEKAGRLERIVAAWGALPEQFGAIHLVADAEADRGARALLIRVVTSVGVPRRDLAAVQLWARELHAALAAQEDLHRWLELLCTNQLDSLDFQVLGEGLFTECASKFGGEGQEPYNAPAVISRFPGGSLGVTALNNYFEVERQGEGLFRINRDWAVKAEGSAALVTQAPASVWMPPEVREAFVAMRRRLGAANRATWDRAAAMPYERSFMANQLFRPLRAGVLERLGVALERFDARHPRATVAELMDVLPYRAGLGMSGIEWGDRFDERLMAAAGKLAGGSRREAFMAAHAWAHDTVYKGSANYKGMVLTLRKALDMGKYDCIRGTDMIGALYRNAGWPGFLNVRWCRGASAHTIAGVALRQGEGARVVAVDSLFAPGRRQGTWPESYFTGHPDLYAVELNGRGLDNYVWLQGYVIRGPNAGTLMRAAVPYLPGWDTAGREKVFAGPYPGGRKAGDG